jgi:hypothetical protein
MTRLMEQAPSRRFVLRLLAGGALAAAADPQADAAGGSTIERLIKDAQAYPKVSQRIDVISRALIGVRYAAHTLIGSAKQPERFVVREDAFDCVTYCEVVLAAALARDLPEFEAALRNIRYHQGIVDWRQRNHYWADWCQRSVDNGFCRPVLIGEPVKVHKNVNSEPAVGRREWTLEAMTKSTLLSNGKQLVTGDIIGFVSGRQNLDYFHTGFIAFAPNGELLVRHASRSQRRVVDERMATFATVNPVRYVTLLRPVDKAA